MSASLLSQLSLFISRHPFSPHIASDDEMPRWIVNQVLTRSQPGLALDDAVPLSKRLFETYWERMGMLSVLGLATYGPFFTHRVVRQSIEQGSFGDPAESPGFRALVLSFKPDLTAHKDFVATEGQGSGSEGDEASAPPPDDVLPHQALFCEVTEAYRCMKFIYSLDFFVLLRHGKRTRN